MYCYSQPRSPTGVFLQTLPSISCVFHWGDSSVGPLSHQPSLWLTVWNCFHSTIISSFLQTGSAELSLSGLWVFSYLWPRLSAQLVQTSSGRKSPGQPKHVSYDNGGDLLAPTNNQWSRFMFLRCPDPSLATAPSLSSSGGSFDPMDLFFALICSI